MHDGRGLNLDRKDISPCNHSWNLENIDLSLTVYTRVIIKRQCRSVLMSVWMRSHPPQGGSIVPGWNAPHLVLKKTENESAAAFHPGPMPPPCGNGSALQVNRRITFLRRMPCICSHEPRRTCGHLVLNRSVKRKQNIPTGCFRTKLVRASLNIERG